MRASYLKVFLILLSFFITTTFFANNVAAGKIKRIFIVCSYEKNNVCSQPQYDGILSALGEQGWINGKNITIATHYMNTKRKNNTPVLIKKQASIALARIRKFIPDVVITVDDNAFRTVALSLVDKPVKIVFSGMNNQPEEYNRVVHFMESRKNPGHNITGVYEKLHARESAQVLSNIIDLKKVRMLTDLSPTGKAISRQIEIELEASNNIMPPPCLVDFHTIKTWEEYGHEIKAINSDPAISAYYLATLLLKDASGKTYTAPEIINYSLKHAKKPAMCPNYAFIKLGLFGGACVDFFAMGRQTGEIIADILSGADPKKLPIQDAKRIALVFNLKRAKTLGIDIPQDILLAADDVFRK